MRILLDECVDRRLGREIPGHTVATVADVGWVGITNGELLRRAASDFDVLITVDRNLPFQQHLSNFKIAVVLLESASSRLSDLLPLLPKLMKVLNSALPSGVTRVGL